MSNVDGIRIAQLEVENNELRKHLEKLIKDNIKLRWERDKYKIHNDALLYGMSAIQLNTKDHQVKCINKEIESALSFLKTKDEVSIAG